MELTDCFRGLSKTMFHCLKLEQKHISKNYLELCKILIKIAALHKGKAEPQQLNFAADNS